MSNLKEEIKHLNLIEQIAIELANLKEINDKNFIKILRKYPKEGNKLFSKDEIIQGICYLTDNKLFKNEKLEINNIISSIKMKPTRSISGVTTVTVLTKPFACPGKCIFCPNDVRMPKSYIASEPGAQRALDNKFDPYFQVFNRLLAYRNIGHTTDKIELLILGGTWSYYPKNYKIWFIHECFRAMNDFGNKYKNELINIKPETKHVLSESIENDKLNNLLREKYGDLPYNQLIQKPEYKEIFAHKHICTESGVTIDDLKKQHDVNSKGRVRCVGLVLETRSDAITAEEVLLMRQLGATKVQLGIQTLNDEISKINERGETREQIVNAFELLRQGGFKIHGHIMPNLYGATPEIDLKVFKELFDCEEFRPDELKIYPTSIIKFTKLYQLWRDGKYKPYGAAELVNLLAKCIEYTPPYCRLNRIIRDIPSNEISDGNTTTNLREVVEDKLKEEKRKNLNIRAREIRNKKVNMAELRLNKIKYETKGSTEFFLEFVNKDYEIAGFLRLSIPKNRKNKITNELNDCTIIREVHVYGPALELSKQGSNNAQHIGLGTKLIEKSKEITKNYGFNKVAVISAIGTREYYYKRGFTKIGDWMICEL